MCEVIARKLAENCFRHIARFREKGQNGLNDFTYNGPMELKCQLPMLSLPHFLSFCPQVDIKYKLDMTRFEPWISGIESDRTTNHLRHNQCPMSTPLSLGRPTARLIESTTSIRSGANFIKKL